MDFECFWHAGAMIVDEDFWSRFESLTCNSDFANCLCLEGDLTSAALNVNIQRKLVCLRIPIQFCICKLAYCEGFTCLSDYEIFWF